MLLTGTWEILTVLIVVILKDLNTVILLIGLILKYWLFQAPCSYSVWVIILQVLLFFYTIICLSAHFSVQGPRCRYAIGRILSEGEDEADPELLHRCAGSGFNVFSFPEAAHVVTTSLPHRTVFSVPVGVGRVYSKLEHYIKVRTDPLLPVDCF